MTARTPLYWDGSSLKEMTSGEITEWVTQTIFQYANNPSVVLTVTAGSGNITPDTANVHVIGSLLVTTTATATGGVIVPNDGDIGSTGATDAMQISSDGIVTFKDDIKIKDGGTIGSATTPAAITVASDGIVTFADDIKIKDGGTIGSATTASAITVADIGAVTLADDLAVTGNATVTLGLGAAGNSAPDIDTASFGNPANVIIRAVSQKGGNVIIGDATATSDKSLDVRGTANVGALTATTGTYSGRLVVDDTTEATSTTDGSLQTDGGLSVAGDAVFGDDIKLITDASVASFGVNGEITLTHVHNTGLLLEDSGGSPTLQFHDANESVSSDGSKLILTSNGVAFNLPTADGSSGQVLQTDGSRTLSFTDVSTDLDPATELASDTDCGTAVAAADGQDAFGVAIDDAFVELDLKTQGANKLGTVDMGALS